MQMTSSSAMPVNASKKRRSGWRSSSCLKYSVFISNASSTSNSMTGWHLQSFQKYSDQSPALQVRTPHTRGKILHGTAKQLHCSGLSTKKSKWVARGVAQDLDMGWVTSYELSGVILGVMLMPGLFCRMRKLMYRVVFPFDLKLRNTTDDCCDADQTYSLFAVVVHVGSGPNHGSFLDWRTPQVSYSVLEQQFGWHVMLASSKPSHHTSVCMNRGQGDNMVKTKMGMQAIMWHSSKATRNGFSLMMSKWRPSMSQQSKWHLGHRQSMSQVAWTMDISLCTTEMTQKQQQCLQWAHWMARSPKGPPMYNCSQCILHL